MTGSGAASFAGADTIGSMVRAAGLILAAGTATRFGADKLLAELDGRPMLQHVLDLAATTGLRPVAIVVGRDAAAIEAACTWRNEIRIVNGRPDEGISGSVRLGLARLEEAAARRALVLLGDQPRLTANQVKRLLAAPLDAARPIVVPRFDGVPGSPVLLERAAWPLARDLTGDRGMSQLFASRPEMVRYVDIEGTNPDVDTPADLENRRSVRRDGRRTRHPRL
jgi:molybdenum cofactor cytidylyltransferase